MKIELNYIPLGVEDINIPEGMDIGTTPATNTPLVPTSDLNIVPAPGGSVVEGGALQSPNLVTGWKIDADGSATFKSIQIGGETLQYTLTDEGIFSFGDGSDGDVTISADTNLTSDKYYNDLTIDATKTLNPKGYRIFVKGTLTVNGTIALNGNAGGNGVAGQSPDDSGNNRAGGAGGAAGAALADGYLKGSVAGKAGVAGGVGGDTNANDAGAGSGGTAGANTSNSIGSDGVAGANGGAGGAGWDGDSSGYAGGGAGTGGGVGTATASNVKLIANWHLATMLDVGSTGALLKFDNSAGSGSGAGGGGGGGAQRVAFDRGWGGGGGGGGGSASSGGIVAIYAKIITIGAAGVISANGGVGGNGANGGQGSSEGTGDGGGGGGGGGGAGGNGGQVILVYNTLTNNGSLTASGGAGGSGGTGGQGGDTGDATSGSNGVTGTTGTAGTIRQFSLSL